MLNPGRFTLPTEHRYWRVFIANPQTGQTDWTSVNRIEMYSSALDGPKKKDRCTGGTVLFSTQGGLFGNESAAKAFDDINGDIWTTSPSGAARLNCYIGYDFGTPINIDRFSMQAREGSITQTPMDFSLQYSDDNSSWTTLFTPASQTSWGLQEQRVFTAPSYSQSYSGSPHGAHRYWRIHMSLSDSGGFTFSAAEIEMRATPSGADQCSGGTASAHSVFGSNPGSFDADKVFDNNNATLWSANGSNADGWIKYDFGSGVTVSVAEIAIRARNDGSFGQTPRYGVVEWSDNGTTWNSAWYYAMASGYAAGTNQVSTDPAYV